MKSPGANGPRFVVVRIGDSSSSHSSSVKGEMNREIQTPTTPTFKSRGCSLSTGFAFCAWMILSFSLSEDRQIEASAFGRHEETKIAPLRSEETGKPYRSSPLAAAPPDNTFLHFKCPPPAVSGNFRLCAARGENPSSSSPLLSPTPFLFALSERCIFSPAGAERVGEAKMPPLLLLSSAHFDVVVAAVVRERWRPRGPAARDAGDGDGDDDDDASAAGGDVSMIYGMAAKRGKRRRLLQARRWKRREGRAPGDRNISLERMGRR